MQIPEYVRRELSEVYLLMDHLADCEDKSLEQALAMAEQGGNTQISIRSLCQIPFPPQGGAPERAEQLTNVLIAKDRLAHAASPATGLSIAFTYLSTAEETAWWPRRLWRTIANALFGGGGSPPAEASTMVEFAVSAFPSLRHKRQWLTVTVWRLTFILMVLLGLACYVMWDLAVGQHLASIYDAAMVQLAAKQSQIDAAAVKLNTAIDADVTRTRQSLIARDPGLSAVQAMATQAIEQAGAVRAPPAPVATGPQRPGRSQAKPKVDAGLAAARTALATDAETVVHAGRLVSDGVSALLSASSPAASIAFCDRPRLRPTLAPAGGGEPVALYDTPDQKGLCDARDQLSRQIAASRRALGAWVQGQWLLGHYVHAAPAALSIATDESDEQLARVFLSVINYNVLPVLLGALAATAAGLRSIGRKVEGNTLLPRDLKFVWVRLTLGAFLGAVIGLFISPSGTEGLYALVGLGAAAATGTAGGGIALSAPTFSFLAGFATERIFSWLEQLIGHIFSFGDPSDTSSARSAVR
jgi:hypothetical protein